LAVSAALVPLRGGAMHPACHRCIAPADQHPMRLGQQLGCPTGGELGDCGGCTEPSRGTCHNFDGADGGLSGVTRSHRSLPKGWNPPEGPLGRWRRGADTKPGLTFRLGPEALNDAPRVRTANRPERRAGSPSCAEMTHAVGSAVMVCERGPTARPQTADTGPVVQPAVGPGGRRGHRAVAVNAATRSPDA
jgi:hypothetical protein